MNDAQLNATITRLQARIERLEGLSRSLLVVIDQQDQDHNHLTQVINQLAAQVRTLQSRVR